MSMSARRVQSKGKVLIIDDSETVLRLAQARLEDAGYEVLTTTQTVGAGRMLRGVDLVIVDFHMPGLDGAEVAESLRAAAGGVGAKPGFYLYTSDSKLRGRAQELGFDGELVDKANYDALAAQVDAALRLMRLRLLRAEKKA
jgi:two-component system, OmpR family, response regulator